MFYAENYAGFKKILERVKYYNQQAKAGSSACAGLWNAKEAFPVKMQQKWPKSSHSEAQDRFTKNSNYLPIDYFEPSKLLEACAAKEGTKAGFAIPLRCKIACHPG